MNVILNTQDEQIEDLKAQARRALYSVARMTVLLGRSPRQLERDCATVIGRTLREWLKDLRLRDGLGEIIRGRTISEASSVAGYNHPQNFSIAFKKAYGYSPSGAKINGGDRRVGRLNQSESQTD